jgi:hypothetical protein
MGQKNTGFNGKAVWITLTASPRRYQFIQYVVTQVPLTGLWVSKGQVLVKEDEILKVVPPNKCNR